MKPTASPPAPLTCDELRLIERVLGNPELTSELRECNKVLGRFGYFRSLGKSRLTAEQWLALADGFAKGAGKTEKKNLEKVLAEVRYVPKVAQRNKPGRPKEDTTNSSGKELQVLRSALRASLGLDGDPTQLCVYQIAYVLLSMTDDLLKTWLFFADEDYHEMASLRESARNLQIDFVAEQFPEFDDFIGTFETADALVPERLCDLIPECKIHVEEILQGRPRKVGAYCLPKTEKEAFDDFACLLGLDDPGGIRAAQIKQDKEAKELGLRAESSAETSGNGNNNTDQCPSYITDAIARLDAQMKEVWTKPSDAPQPETKSGFVVERSGITRADVLRNLLARLRWLDQLFIDVDQGIHNDDLEIVRRILHDDSLIFTCAPDGMVILDGIHSVLRNACQRQGPNPLSIGTMDSILPIDPVSERGTSTGGYLDGRRATRELSLRRHFTKIKTPLPENTPVHYDDATKAKSSNEKAGIPKGKKPRRSHAKAAQKATK